MSKIWSFFRSPARSLGRSLPLLPLQDVLQKARRFSIAYCSQGIFSSCRPGNGITARTVRIALSTYQSSSTRRTDGTANASLASEREYITCATKKYCDHAAIHNCINHQHPTGKSVPADEHQRCDQH